MQPSYSPPATSPAPRIGDWLNEALSLFGRNWVTWCLQGLLYSLLPLVPLLVGMGVFGFGMYTALGVSTANGSVRTEPNVAVVLGVVLAATGIGLVPCLAMLAYFLVGMMHTATRQLRGEPIALGDMFQPGIVGIMGIALRAMGASLVVGLVVVLGLLLCVVPGLLAAALFFYVHPLIVERRLGVWAAMSESIRLTRPHLVNYTLWMLLIYLVQAIGSAVVIGYIVTLPLSVLMWMIAYRDATGDPIFSPSSAVAATNAPEFLPWNEG